MRWNDGVSVPDKNIKLHKVVLLDCSGSMKESKYKPAEEGVRKDYEACKTDFADYLLVEFSTEYRSTLYDFTKELYFKPYFMYTHLYRTIYEVLSKVLNDTPKEDKVLVQIFTDGRDEGSPIQFFKLAKEIIEKFNSIGWTVTFVGTKADVQYVQNHLSIDSTNTLVHDNTASGVAQSFEVYRGATSLYTKAVKKGEEVTRGFFKSIK